DDRLLRCCVPCACMPSSFRAACAPRSLPSFPTRRSSDLCDVESAQTLASIASGQIHSPPPIAGDGLERLRLSLPVEQVRRRHSGDRKSTRLNSSHLGISYAVFCLKKKSATTTRSASGSET